MKFNLLSDIHLEFAPLFGLKGGDILLLAGDISLACVLDPKRTDVNSQRVRYRFQQFLDEEVAKYDKAFYIAGNHEHYNGFFYESHDLIRNYLKDTKVQFLQNEIVYLENDIALFGSTMWTDFQSNNPVVKEFSRYNMNDYNLIYKKLVKPEERTVRINPDDVLEDHYTSYYALKEALNTHKNNRFVVMTHHTPSMQSSHPRWGGTDNPLNYAYCNFFEDLIIDNPNIKYWVHGHTHESHDYVLGETRVICNPRGYAYAQRPEISENQHFNVDLEFELV